MGKFRVMAAGLAAACFLTSMAGCTAYNTNPRGTMPNGTLTRQGTNMINGVNPNSMLPGTGYTAIPGTGLTATPRTGLTATPRTGLTAVPSRPGTQPMTFDMIRAENIVRNMGHIDGSRNVKAVVKGNTALVGYTPSGTLRNTLATKSAIVKKVKTLDKSISNVVVTESASVVNDINKLANDIRNNRTGMDLSSTFNKLVHKVQGR